MQGVWYRESTKRKADELRVTGWVRNEEDGTVSALAQGRDSKVDELVDWCHTGPELAQVTKVEVKEIDEQKDYDSFEVEW